MHKVFVSSTYSLLVCDLPIISIQNCNIILQINSTVLWILPTKKLSNIWSGENSKYVFIHMLFSIFYSFGYSLPNHFFIDIVHVIIMHWNSKVYKKWISCVAKLKSPPKSFSTEWLHFTSVLNKNSYIYFY